MNISGSSKSAAAGSAIIYTLSNGTYSYTVSTSNKLYHPSSYTGSVTVSGVTKTTVTFVKTTYTVEFTESGLPSGTPWYVNITGFPSGPITHDSYNFSLQNGSYTYSISTSDKDYAPNAYTGSLTVNGPTSPVAITFLPVTYTVTFTESGLPSGTPWYVNITGLPTSGPITQTSYSVSLSNGTYMYSISTSDKDYAPNAYTGSVQVTGASTSAPSTSFTLQTFSVTFTESGLASGTWYVNISGSSKSAAAGSAIIYTLSNGTYSYTVSTSNKLYHPSSYTGSVTVSGVTKTTVTFSQSPSTSAPPYVIYALVVVIVVIVALASIVVIRRMHR